MPLHRHSPCFLLVSGLGFSFSLAGCDYGMGMSDLGITQGGMQDIEYSRQIITNGGIPREELFSAEGLFSEHDLPLSGEDCDRLLCPRAAAALIDPVDRSGRGTLVQLGFGTNVDADNFERRPLNLALVVDVSCSMAGDRIEKVRNALHTAVDQLNDKDRVSLVAFDDEAWVEQSPTIADIDGRDRLHVAISRLEDQGGTHIEAGLKLGFSQVGPYLGAEGVEDRVMLLTDALPNVGATSADSFMQLTNGAANDGIGLSLFGVGLVFGQELIQAMSNVRGGNAWYLADDDSIEQVFDEEFAFMVSPVAYDLEVHIRSERDMSMIEAFGAPLDEPGREMDFGVPTLFLSKRNGGMGVLLDRSGMVDLSEDQAGVLAHFDLTYERVDDGSIEGETLAVTWDGGDAYTMPQAAFPRADDVGVFKMANLVDEFKALQAGSDFCAERLAKDEAIARIEAAAARLAEAATSEVSDADNFSAEAELMSLLAENVKGGAGNCSVR